MDIRPAGPFPCPFCKALLVASEYYALSTLLASLGLAAVVFVLLGFRGSSLVHALLLAFIPVLVSAANFFKYVIPPLIEPYATKLHLRD